MDLREIDELIISANRGEMTYRSLTNRCHRSSAWITRRAVVLGLPSKSIKSPNKNGGGSWSDEEIELLSEHSDDTISELKVLFARHGYYRTEYSILNARTLYRLAGRIPEIGVNRDYYIERDICKYLNVNQLKVKRWIDKGLLVKKAIGKEFRIKRKNLRDFMINYPYEWDHTKVDQYWLIDILANRQH